MSSEIIDSIFIGVNCVWLDLDDTLIDFHTNSRTALRLLYDLERLERFYPTPSAWIEAYEIHNHSLWDRYSKAEISQEFLRMDRFVHPLRQTWSGSQRDLEDFSRRLDPLYLDLLAQQKKLVDGAMELLEALRAAGFNTGILSNGFTEVQHKKLRMTGLDKMIDYVVLSDDIGVNKPDVRLYRHAMQRATDPVADHHLMIGDNPSTDIAGASAAGWRSILLSASSDDDNEMESNQKSARIYNLHELITPILSSK
ncbi:MAG: YjjG family noncanonical pyrimidine nucleotidase [Muribaculaceae bacterium]|nr:YjjG family noncanonical pyrimidine nucleotidase [Muribaculaceae bacterium]